MNTKDRTSPGNLTLDTCQIELSDEDVMRAMKSIPGYIDITPADFKEIYAMAYKLAVTRISQSVRAGSIMSSPVYAVSRDDSLLVAATMMAQNDISGLPVIDESFHVVGVISEKDFLTDSDADRSASFMSLIAQCIKNKGCAAVSFRKQQVKDVMTSPAVTVKETATTQEIADILNTRQINRVPVIDSNACLTGIITRSNLVRSYCSS